MQVSGPVKEDTVTGPKIAAVERREARVPGNNGTRHLPRCQTVTSAFPALRSLTPVRERRRGRPPRPPNNGDDESRLLNRRDFRFECWTFWRSIPRHRRAVFWIAAVVAVVAA